ncbi:Gfo/Idh/MocA family protein [Verrucomicrobium spinosum]|uniref:Gfo/Idh/MocA family protein n=1 Tax=Verrucomicrobium spinosum TaxID=2736 RepID=UPI0009466DB9|nr:Gfo/Idh/MocA family oxidoreductase [Verrucomicrobium spinosum]
MNSPTRRSFLKTSTTALVATISARTAFGSQANSRIKVGMVGCGGRGGLIAKMFVENGYFEIGGAADYFADKAQKLGSAYQLGADRAFSGLECAEKMIAKGGLDAIAIISPPYFHPAQAKAAVDAGLHVYLAKPVAVDVPGIQSVRTSGEQARAKKRVFLIDFQSRTDSFFIEAMKRVQAGALGDLAFGEARYHAGRLKPKGTGTTPEDRLNNWVFDKALSGDIVVEQNIHTLDMMSWAFGNAGPLKATATCARRVRIDVGDANDTFSGLLEYPNQVA